MFTVHSFEVLLPRWLYKTYCPERELFKFGISAVLLSSCQCGESIKHTQNHTCVSSIMIREGQAECNHKHKAGPYITVFIISTHTAEKGRTKIKREGGRAREMKWKCFVENVKCQQCSNHSLQFLSLSKRWQRLAQRQILKCLAHNRGTQFSQILRSGCHAPFFYFEGVAVEVLVHSLPRAKITHD